MLKRFRAAVTNEELEQKLYGKAGTKQAHRRLAEPDWSHIHQPSSLTRQQALVECRHEPRRSPASLDLHIFSRQVKRKMSAEAVANTPLE